MASKKVQEQLNSDHDMLITINANMEFVKVSLATGSSRMQKMQEQIEKLKEYQSRQMGMSAAIGTIVSVFLTLIIKGVIKIS